jgi:hypothetical protein
VNTSQVWNVSMKVDLRPSEPDRFARFRKEVTDWGRSTDLA